MYVITSSYIMICVSPSFFYVITVEVLGPMNPKLGSAAIRVSQSGTLT